MGVLAELGVSFQNCSQQLLVHLLWLWVEVLCKFESHRSSTCYDGFWFAQQRQLQMKNRRLLNHF